VVRSKQVTSSSSFAVSLPREWTNTRPPAITGIAKPFPTGARHLTFGAVSLVHTATFSVVPPSRFGPSHCGQSSACEISGGTINRQLTVRTDRHRVGRIIYPLSY